MILIVCPTQTFSFDKLPSKPLQFKTSILAPPAIIKASAPSVQKGKPLSIFDFGQIHGLKAKFITCLLKDKNGLLWIASGEGLFRYDGEHIRTYVSVPGLEISSMAWQKITMVIFGLHRKASIGMINPINGTD